MQINRTDNASAPKARFSASVNLLAAYPREISVSDADLMQKVKSAVLAKLDGEVDSVLLDAVITRVLASFK